MAHPGAFRFYRFTFAPTSLGSFQVSEITLVGIALPGAATGENYRRDLNLMDGVARICRARRFCAVVAGT